MPPLCVLPNWLIGERVSVTLKLLSLSRRSRGLAILQGSVCQGVPGHWNKGKEEPCTTLVALHRRVLVCGRERQCTNGPGSLGV